MRVSAETVNARRKEVLELIRQGGKASASSLAEQLHVSPLTLRRDLDALEAEGLVHRFHGGASAVLPGSEDTPAYDDKAISHVEEKKIIAEYIANLIPEHATVYLNAGTTTLEVIRRLANKGVTIITNNALAFHAVSGGNCELISTGGTFNAVSNSYDGELATGIVQKTYAEYCVLGINGISAESGVTSSFFSETAVNEMMMQHCNKSCIIAADSSKIGKTYRFSSLRLHEINLLVTVSSSDPEKLRQLAAQGVRIAFADKP